MPQLLLELLTEEIPARMQAKAQADLERAVMDGLTAAGLMPEGIKALSGPRRLVVAVDGLPEKSADVKEERKGPKVGAPDKAIEGFMRGAGLSSIDQAETRSDKKGEFYVAIIEKPGRKTVDVVAELVPNIVRGFHWPKSMRWGDGDLRWVRPLQRILCTFDGEIVPFEIDGVASGNITEGHRIMGRGPYKVRRFEDYEEALKNKGHVILDRDERKEIIAADAKTLCEAQNLELVEDIGLLEEVAGLAEYPVVIIGDMDPKFLSLPPEVIKLSMRTHQKYFAVRDPATGELAPKFVVVANLRAADGGKTIAAGNSKVLSARLSDGVFFWENDKSSPLEDNFDKLGTVTFHEKLGSVKDKAERVIALAGELAEAVGANADDARTAARLAKCDLVSDMVFEFTELEGVMGRYYALDEARAAGVIPASSPVIPAKAGTHKSTQNAESGGSRSSDMSETGMTASWCAGLDAPRANAIADAIRDHYKPKGPSDDIPTEPTAVAVALADKLDTLVGFWAIDEKPTGSKDPFALRRAALGDIRLVLENGVRLRLKSEFAKAWLQLLNSRGRLNFSTLEYLESKYPTAEFNSDGPLTLNVVGDHPLISEEINNLLSFFADRLKVYLKDQGKRHDLIDAVFALGEDDLVLIVKRVDALSDFLATEDGTNLLAGYKRATNILSIEEKKDKTTYTGEVDAQLLVDDAERSLHASLQKAVKDTDKALKAEDFAKAMAALSQLRTSVDSFFDDVMVNDDDKDTRINRLKLLSQIRDVMGRVADFSKIEG
ncbi:MAG: glycine--tRNA ligase subunit beta [Hirschia sp.]|nr:glycine--tRNA ligase subunit beta [Hirschia sp.]MBF17006.1 glycine--tRNA ligase subunit beta [Hirschia sp.]